MNDLQYTLQEWLAEGKRRFGEDMRNWKFICPACGRINAGHEFKEIGVEPNFMYSTCIGRHNSRGIRGIEHKSDTPAPEFGCDWTANGLFGTLNGGCIVVADGKETPVFSFAEV